MRRTHRRAYGLLIAGIASVALLPVGTVARAQERAAQSIVDGAVNAVWQKQIVLLGELPTHGEARKAIMLFDVMDESTVSGAHLEGQSDAPTLSPRQLK